MDTRINNKIHFWDDSPKHIPSLHLITGLHKGNIRLWREENKRKYFLPLAFGARTIVLGQCCPLIQLHLCSWTESPVDTFSYSLLRIAPLSVPVIITLVSRVQHPVLRNCRLSIAMFGLESYQNYFKTKCKVSYMYAYLICLYCKNYPRSEPR